VVDYFSRDYFTARDRFRESARRAGGILHTLPITAKGPEGEALTIDIAWFGAASPRRVLLHSSGLHGVEGFAGSAIQIQLLDRMPAIAIDAALVIVHILNPYGMAWLRRTNENNVDLNRNFRTDGKYEGAPETYSRLDAFLNPPTPPHADLFYARAVYLILRYGMAAVTQSVVGGQYEYPKGLFYGGHRLEEGPRKYEEFLRTRLAVSEDVTAIDVHTGLGKYGQDLRLVESDTVYRVEGGLESMIFRIFPNKPPRFIGQEFCTYSGVRVLQALREENRWHHYGRGSLDHPVKRRLKHVFCPDDPTWQAAVLRRGRELIDEVF